MTKRYIKKIINDIPKHYPQIYYQIKQQYDTFLDNNCLDKIYELIEGLQEFNTISRKMNHWLVLSIVVGICKGRIDIFSICSNSLTKDPNVLRDKPQYKKANYVRQQLEQLSSIIQIPIRYFCILPDIDIRFPYDIYEKSWIGNQKQISDITHCETLLLSSLSNGLYEDVRSNLGRYINIDKLEEQIEYYTKNVFIVLGFAASQDFQRRQIIDYTTTGIVLEKVLPYGILLDIQKRNFPFEQKFYNYARKEKLPIIFSGQSY